MDPVTKCCDHPILPPSPTKTASSEPEVGLLSMPIHPDGTVEGGLFDPEYYRYPAGLFDGTWEDGMKAIEEFQWWPVSTGDQHSGQDKPCTHAPAKPNSSLGQAGANVQSRMLHTEDAKSKKPAGEHPSEVELACGPEARPEQVEPSTAVSLDTGMVNMPNATEITHQEQVLTRNLDESTTVMSPRLLSEIDPVTSDPLQESATFSELNVDEGTRVAVESDKIELDGATPTPFGGAGPEVEIALVTMNVKNASTAHATEPSVTSTVASQDPETTMVTLATNTETGVDVMDVVTEEPVAVDPTHTIHVSDGSLSGEHIYHLEHVIASKDVASAREESSEGKYASPSVLLPEVHSFTSTSSTEAIDGHDSGPSTPAPFEKESEKNALYAPSQSKVLVQFKPVIWQPTADSTVDVPSAHRTLPEDVDLELPPPAEEATRDTGSLENNIFEPSITVGGEESIEEFNALDRSSSLPPCPLDDTGSLHGLPPTQAIYPYQIAETTSLLTLKEIEAEGPIGLQSGAPIEDKEGFAGTSEPAYPASLLQSTKHQHEPAGYDAANALRECELPPMLLEIEAAAAALPSAVSTTNPSSTTTSEPLAVVHTSISRVETQPEQHPTLATDLPPSSFAASPPITGAPGIDTAAGCSFSKTATTDGDLEISGLFSQILLHDPTEAVSRRDIVESNDTDNALNDAAIPTGSTATPETEFVDAPPQAIQTPVAATAQKRTVSGATRTPRIKENEAFFEPDESPSSGNEAPKKKRKPDIATKTNIKISAQSTTKTNISIPAAKKKAVMVTLNNPTLQREEEVVDAEETPSTQNEEQAETVQTMRKPTPFSTPPQIGNVPASSHDSAPAPAQIHSTLTTGPITPHSAEQSTTSSKIHKQKLTSTELSYRHPLELTYGKRHTRADTKHERQKTESSTSSDADNQPAQLQTSVVEEILVDAEPVKLSRTRKPAPTKEANARSKRAKPAPSDAYTDSEEDMEEEAREAAPPALNAQKSRPTPKTATMKPRTTRATSAAVPLITPAKAAPAKAPAATNPSAKVAPNKYGFKNPSGPRKLRVAKGKAKAEKASEEATPTATQQRGEGLATMRQTRRASAAQEQLEKEAEKRRNIGLRLRSGDAKK